MVSNRSKKINRFASIDIGTNTVLMVVADITEEGTIIPVYDGQQLPRLGKGVDNSRTIPHESVERVVRALHTFKDTAESLHAAAIFACGTSALRDADNRDEVLRRIMRETKMEIDILSGETEAEYTYLGALSGLPPFPGTTGVLDIGGGSTELVTGTGTTVESRSSIDIGCVRLTERYLTSLPPSRTARLAAHNSIQNELQKISNTAIIDRLIGVAGTVTTLAAIMANLQEFNPEIIDGYVLSKETIESMQHKYSQFTLDEMRNITQIPRGREDILLAGIYILTAYMNRFEMNSITVSTRGLRYGQLLAKTST